MANHERELQSHFAFGENWSSYSLSVDSRHINSATSALVRLLGREDLQGVKFCDVGCGSGIHAVAAAHLGAEVTAIDIDPASCQTTLELAERFNVQSSVTVLNRSVFELEGVVGDMDIVYSWGVLHHSGDMWSAIDSVCNLVSPSRGALLVIALYRRTYLCNLWRMEKRLYSRAPAHLQRMALSTFEGVYNVSQRFKGRNPKSDSESYFRRRGMSRHHDFHDWLGGYPYESAMPEDVWNFVERRGFNRERELLVLPQDKKAHGLFGSGCDQYVFRRA